MAEQTTPGSRKSKACVASVRPHGWARPVGPEQKDGYTALMSWSWRYEEADGEPLRTAEPPPAETFPTQSDAENWLGEEWRTLLAAGVARVTLLEDDRVVYGPMSLDPQT